MQVQGPSSAKTLEKLVGPAIYDLKYYWCDWFEIGGIPVLISRTGYTAVPGFEVNILDASRGTELWDAILAAGEEFAIRPAIPSMIRRLEAGIFNYGSDMTLENNPFELSGMERLVEEQSQPYIGKDALERIRREGVSRKLVGIEIDGAELTFDPTGFWPVHNDGKEVGKVTDAVWSPRLEKNIGFVWVQIELAEPGNRLDIESERGHLSGQTAAIPFVDPKKEVPAGTLRS
jgi:aminomethyltransferase